MLYLQNTGTRTFNSTWECLDCSKKAYRVLDDTGARLSLEGKKSDVRLRIAQDKYPWSPELNPTKRFYFFSPSLKTISVLFLHEKHQSFEELRIFTSATSIWGTASGEHYKKLKGHSFTFPGVGWDPNIEDPWEITVLLPCTMLPWNGPKGPLLPLVLSLLLTTCAGQDSLEDLELDDESNSVSTESPVSSALMSMWCAPVLMHKGMISCGLFFFCCIIQEVKSTVIFVLDVWK